MIKKKAIFWGIAIWIIITLIFSVFNAHANGFISIGFPWHFYSYKTMEASSGSALTVSFLLIDFLLDLIALLALIILLNIILLNRRKHPKIS